LGVKKEIKYQHSVLCSNCNGVGYPSDSKLKTCKHCNGKGYVEHRRSIPLFGTINEQVVCTECNGEGKIPEKKCEHCNAAGYVTQTKTETIEIPSGIRNGDVLELKNYGNIKNKKYKAGNLYIRVLVKEDKEF
jgi:molecular chaperone DnaJ